MTNEKTNVIQLAPLEKPRSAPSTAPTTFQSVELALVDRWATHPGYGLTPKKVMSIFRQADSGFPQQQCDLFDDVIESDGHLRSALETSNDSVAGKTWSVQAGGEAEIDILAAKALDEAMRLVPNFAETLEHQITGNWYGFAHSEATWERRDLIAIPSTRITVPTWFSNTPHRRFVFDENDRARLITRLGDPKGDELIAGKWWQARRRGRIAAASGLMRTATWWALFKRLSVRDWVIFAERFGLPFVLGKYTDSMTPEERQKLREAVASIGKDGYATFHEDGSIEFPQVERGGKSDDVHGALVSLCNQEISKLITGATLTADGGSGVGSYAQANVHEGVKFDRVLAVAERISSSFEQQVGVPFVRYNGMAAKPPRLKIHVVRDVDPTARMGLYSTAANELGLELDEDEVRQTFQMKAPTGKALKGTKNAGKEKAPGGAPAKPE